MNLIHGHDPTLAEHLAPHALQGDLDAACLLGVVEAPYAEHTDLRANPAAARVYAAARAVELRRLDDEWHEIADQVGAALL